MKSRSFVSAIVAVAGLLASATLLSGTAFAQVSGYYIGASAGQSQTNNDHAPFTALGAIVTKDDERNSAFRIFGGYQFTKHLGIEVAYVDLGAFGVSGTISGAPFIAFGDVNGGSISGVATLPLTEKIDLIGSIGVFYSKVKASASVASVEGAARDGETDFTAGIGMKYNLSRNWAARFEANHYELGDNGNARMYSLGFQYKF